MVRISVLGDALKTLSNAEKRGKRQVLLRPSSKVVIKFLAVMLKKGYIGEFEFVDDHRAGKIIVELNGRLNKCGVISPRYDIPHDSIEDWVSWISVFCFFFFFKRGEKERDREKENLTFFFSLSHLGLSLFFLKSPPQKHLQVARLLPSRLFGVIVLTTSAGIMDHEEARRKKVGGKVLGFFY